MRAEFIGAVGCQVGACAVTSITAVAACALDVLSMTEAAPTLYRIFPGRYITDEPFMTPLEPPTCVQVWFGTFRKNDLSSDGPIVNTFPFGARYENGYSSSCTCDVLTFVSGVHVLADGSYTSGVSAQVVAFVELPLIAT